MRNIDPAKKPTTLSTINLLPDVEKRRIYARLIPAELYTRFNITQQLYDAQGNDLFTVQAEAGRVDAELMLYPYFGAPDPVLHGHITDTLHGNTHILIYEIMDPSAPRFNIDYMPDGRITQLGALCRNLPEELAAMEAGLAPGQIRAGLRLLSTAIKTFERFVMSLSQKMYFAEPLYYHNALLFERYGFAYQQGRSLMERIQSGFSPEGDLLPLLDSGSPFRRPGAIDSIRLRSWAIHDGILGSPFRDVTMYKHIGKNSGIQTCPNCTW